MCLLMGWQGIWKPGKRCYGIKLKKIRLAIGLLPIKFKMLPKFYQAITNTTECEPYHSPKPFWLELLQGQNKIEGYWKDLRRIYRYQFYLRVVVASCKSFLISSKLITSVWFALIKSHAKILLNQQRVNYYDWSNTVAGSKFVNGEALFWQQQTIPLHWQFSRTKVTVATQHDSITSVLPISFWAIKLLFLGEQSKLQLN